MAKAKFYLAGAVLAGFAVAATGAMAAGDPIKERKALMKEVVLKSFKATQAMVKGETPYDAKAAAAAVTAISEVAPKFAKLFPKGSETGGETAAKPEVWSKSDDFQARLVKFSADAKAAAAATPKGAEGFKVAWTAMAKNCGACHKIYKVKK